MSRALNDLSPEFRPQAVELLARLTEARLACLITCTLRTAEEQALAVARGASKVTHSRHQDGEAIDIVLYETYQLHGGGDKLDWDQFQHNADGSVARDAAGRKIIKSAWLMVGSIAEGLGLRWGGRFGESAPGRGDGWDPGHAERPKAG